MNYESSKFDRILFDIYKSAVDSAQPYKLIKNKVKLEGECLTICDKKYEVKKPMKIIGLGLVTVGMAIALEEILGDLLQGGMISIPKGSIHFNSIIFKNSKLKFIEGTLDEAMTKIRHSLGLLKPEDIVIVLLSNCESPLLTQLDTGIHEELLYLIRELKKKGANDNEIKCIRRQFSEFDSGGLAKACYPAKVITLRLSDVKNDSMELIANGAMCYNTDDPMTSHSLLLKYNLFNKLPIRFKSILNEKLLDKKLSDENTIPKERRRFLHVDNYLIGNNETAVHGAFTEAKRQGFRTLILSTSIAGVVEEIAKFYVFVAKSFTDFLSGNIDKFRLCQALLNCQWNYFIDKEYLFGKIYDRNIPYSRHQSFCLIASGMPTAVNVGNSGRNRHLAYCFSKGVQNLTNSVFFLSCSTSGFDEGTTDAAGAVGHSALILESFFAEKSDIINFVTYDDSQNFYNSFRDGKYLIKTGPTGTNVGDIHIIIICPNENNFSSTYFG